MPNSYDRSFKDKKYFIDNAIFNCPFCSRKHVSYSIVSKGSFDVSNEKITYFFLVRCADCKKISFHLSEHEIVSAQSESYHGYRFKLPIKVKRLSTDLSSESTSQTTEDIMESADGLPIELDDLFYYHMPSSAFTVDSRIPKNIRSSLTEAENCLKNNFLTGASACLRKAIYKLLKNEKIPEIDAENNYIKHKDRIRLLIEKHPGVSENLLEKLTPIHTLTSQELHENDWKDFDGNTLRFLVEVTNDILTEFYIVPDDRRKRELALKDLERKAKPKDS